MYIQKETRTEAQKRSRNRKDSQKRRDKNSGTVEKREETRKS
jgi:ribosome assembly protein YihI (activator of Der GTPase)